MITRNIINLHGFGSPGGLRNAKAQLFDRHFKPYPKIAFHSIDFTPTAKDFEFHTITGMIDRLRQYILDFNLNPVSLIGSSQGAIVALNYAHRFGNVERLLLLAPEIFYIAHDDADELLEWKKNKSAPVFHYGFGEELPLNYGHHQDGLRYRSAPPPPAPIMIIHGLSDEVIPISHSRLYAGRYPKLVQLIEVDDNHRLGNQSEFIWEQTISFFQL